MKQRVITALIALPIVLALVFSTNPIPIFLLGVTCAFLATGELAWMAYAKRTWIPYASATVFGIVAYILSTHYEWHRDKILGVLAALLLVSVGAMIVRLVKGEKRGLLFPGLFWILCPLMALLVLHYSVPKTQATPWWPNPLLMALVPIWAGDTAAIFVGRKFGKTPLAPKLSPKKTWEGALGNLLFAFIAAVALAPAVGLTPMQGSLIGLVAGTLGQVGDLFESAVKRTFDAKDSGWIMPGHGGLLDRVDSILLAALPITALILYYR